MLCHVVSQTGKAARFPSQKQHQQNLISASEESKQQQKQWDNTRWEKSNLKWLSRYLNRTAMGLKAIEKGMGRVDRSKTQNVRLLKDLSQKSPFFFRSCEPDPDFNREVWTLKLTLHWLNQKMWCEQPEIPLAPKALNEQKPFVESLWPHTPKSLETQFWLYSYNSIT